MYRVCGLPAFFLLLSVVFTLVRGQGSSLPQCAQKCGNVVAEKAGCGSIEDVLCLCEDPSFLDDIKMCTRAGCSKEDLSEALEGLGRFCSVVLPTTTSTSTSSSSTPSLSLSVTFHSTSQTVTGTPSQAVSPPAVSNPAGDLTLPTTAAPSVSVSVQTLISTVQPSTSNTAPPLATAFHTSVVVMPTQSRPSSSTRLGVSSLFRLTLSLAISTLVHTLW
jgi:hypothetical protein